MPTRTAEPRGITPDRVHSATRCGEVRSWTMNEGAIQIVRQDDCREIWNIVALGNTPRERVNELLAPSGFQQVVRPGIYQSARSREGLPSRQYVSIPAITGQEDPMPVEDNIQLPNFNAEQWLRVTNNLMASMNVPRDAVEPTPPPTPADEHWDTTMRVLYDHGIPTGSFGASNWGSLAHDERQRRARRIGASVRSAFKAMGCPVPRADNDETKLKLGYAYWLLTSSIVGRVRQIEQQRDGLQVEVAAHNERAIKAEAETERLRGSLSEANVVMEAVTKWKGASDDEDKLAAWNGLMRACGGPVVNVPDMPEYADAEES